MSDLSFATAEELIGELFKRTDMALVLHVDVKDFIQMSHRGRKVEVLGLAEYARRRLYDLLFTPEPQESPPSEDD